MTKTDCRAATKAASLLLALMHLTALTAAAAEPPVLDPQAVLQDLEVARTQYLPKELAYAPSTRALAEMKLDAIARRAGRLTATEFAVGMAQMVALADNAHSRLWLDEGAWRPEQRLPLRLLWLPDALVVARAHGDAADLAGARVLKVEGRSTEALYAGAKVLIGGNTAYRKQWLPDWIELGGVLHALGLAAAPDRLALTLRLPDGRTVERSVAMVAEAELPPVPEYDRLWSPEPLGDRDRWATAPGAQALPLYLREADLPFRSVPLPELGAHYLQFRSNTDLGDYSIADFVEDAGAEIAASRPRELVVDLRFNIGGNLSLTLDFMRGLAGTVPGRTWLLVGPYTFSAGIISAAAIKQGGGERVVVVGDGLGDRAHFWSEGSRVPLPNSGFALRRTDGQFNLAEGCSGEPACFDDLFPVNVNFVGLAPDVRAPVTADAYLDRRDPAMDAVVERIGRAGGEGR